MAKNELPGMEGPGVELLEIDEIDKAISKYQRMKNARCEASPGEIAAKSTLLQLLHKHRSKLPVNGDGVPFYRSEDRDYLLLETLKVHKVESLDDSDDD